jgi:uncharacterized repeat protein (TIGR03806 family)
MRPYFVHPERRRRSFRSGKTPPVRTPILALLVLLSGSALVFVFGADDKRNSRPYGLARRVPWTTSRVVGSPEPPPPYRPERIFPKLKVHQPLTFKHEPGTRSYLVIQHLGTWAPPGKILRIPNDPSVESPEVLLEISGIAYGLDFHRDYVKNGHLFVGQNLKVNGVGKTRVSRFTVNRQPPQIIDPKSELIIIEWESDGHNGGDLAFGNDGMLYVTSGDGTSGSDVNLRGQDLTHLTSKVLRIDVDHPDAGRAYSVPKDNPFLGVAGARPETWAYGLRNPWRLSFDRETGQLWCGNNGQDLYEQVYLIEKGANYGWSVYEGSHPFQLRRAMGPNPLSPPAAEHHHFEARSLSGGLVYHGKKLPELQGAYIYGDWSTGKIWAVKHDGKSAVWNREIADTVFHITGFGLDMDGELVVIDHEGGFYHLVPAPAVARSTSFPTRLSETGLFASVPTRKPNPALIPYSVNAALWSDGTFKERYIAVPGREKVTFTSGGTGWNFPEGSVLVKTFLLETIKGDPASRWPIETRLLTKQENEWVGYSYAWNKDLSDAVLVSKEGMDRTLATRDPKAAEPVRRQVWHYPSRAECMVCHSRQVNYVLGLSDVQMNKDHKYGKIVDNQLRTLEHIGLFAGALPKPPAEMPHLVDPTNPKATLDQRVRSYLHANCANCHVSDGGGNARIELNIGASLGAMKIVDISPQHDTFDIKNARIVAPGDPERSTLFQRVTRRGPGQMPPLATSVVDDATVSLLRDWITQVRVPPSPPGPAGGGSD